jgi:MFS family permease
MIAILAATLMTPMDVPLISPVLPEVQAVFGLTEAEASRLITLYAVPGILLGPVIGALADRFSRRLVLTICLTVFGLVGTGIAFSNSFATALWLRVLQGFAAGSVLSALAMTVVGDRYAGRQHDAVMGITAAMLSLGTAAYPTIGGILAARAWNAPFLLYSLALPVAILVFFALGDGDSQQHSGRRGYVQEAIHAIPVRRRLVLYGIMFVAFVLLFGGIYTALPFYLVESFGFSPATVGIVTSGMLLVTAVVSTQNGRFTAHGSTRSILAGGFTLFSFGLLGVALAGRPLWLVGALLVFGFGSGLVTPTLFAGISVLAPDRVRGGVLSMQTTIIGTSQAIGPALFALLGGVIGYESTIIVASGGAALFTILIPVVLRD